MELTVGSRRIGPGEPMFIIAEVGLAHDGSLQQAHAYIDACAKAGVDAIKMQCHIDDPTSEWRIRPPWGQDPTRRDYWQRTGFSPTQWQSFVPHCAMRGVEFLCSVFSLDALRVIDPLVRMHKVPSGRVADAALVEAIGRTGKPALISTGLATELELLRAERWLPQSGRMLCTTEYPAPASHLGLSALSQYMGLSDHSGTIFPGLAAAVLGCHVLEVHVCFSRATAGLDADASLTIDDLAALVKGVHFLRSAMRPVNPYAVADLKADMRRVFMV